MRLVTKVVGGLILFIGLALIDFLASPDALYIVSANINEMFKEYKIVGLTGIGIIYVVYQVWLLKPNTATKREIERLKVWIDDLYLMHALQTYYNLLEREGLEPPSSIRINIMLKWRRFWFTPPRLQIVYQACLRKDGKDFENTGCYSNEERHWLWKKGEGTCGQAWKEKEVVFFDSKDPHYAAPQETLRKASREIVSEVASVLSIPIWDERHNKIIGVLNVDSKDNLDKTHFNDVRFKRQFSVTQFFKAKAEELAIVLQPFADGFRK